MTKQYDVVVVGAGQAGLAMGYFLSQTSLSYVLLDSNPNIGDSWRNRYDSLVLFTPRWYSDLPGLPFPGDRNGLPTKDDVADYLELYARTFEIPVHHNTQAIKLEKATGGYKITTSIGEYASKHVVIATGPFHTPYMPQWASNIPEDIYQVHTATYKNPDELKEGPVLVVGMGNSGAQIAVEIAQKHKVFLSIGQDRKFLPIKLFGKSIFWFFTRLGIWSLTVHDRLGKWLSQQPDPVFGYGKELKALNKQGSMIEKPRAVGADGKSAILFEDGTTVEVNSIVWATGFRPDYRWIAIPDVIDENHKPKHHRGVSPVHGIYFLGLPWQYKRGSALLGGVGEDARYLIDFLGS